MLRFYRRLITLVLGVVGVHLFSQNYDDHIRNTFSLSVAQPEHFGHLRVAVFEDTFYHDEVIGAALTVVQDLQANASFYRGNLNKGFEDVFSDTWNLKSNPPRDPNQFATDIENGSFDVIILVTCDAKFWGHRSDVISAFSARKDLHVVCLMHEVEHFGDKEDESRSNMAVPGQEGRLTLLTLSPHSTASLSQSLAVWNDKAEDKWTNVEVINIAPIFSVSDDVLQKPETPIISKAAILGRMHQGRQYDRIISQLHRSMLADPQSWGYSLETSPANKFVSLNDPTNPPFTLHLIGYDEGLIVIPSDLSNIVVKHSDVDYVGFYGLIGEMDLILPAFSGDVYTQHRSSAAIPAAIIAQTPVLADESVASAYTYLDNPAIIRQPASLTEIETIQTLRRHPQPCLRGDASLKEMFCSSTEKESSWVDYIEELRETNEEALARILRRI